MFLVCFFQWEQMEVEKDTGWQSVNSNYRTVQCVPWISDYSKAEQTETLQKDGACFVLSTLVFQMGSPLLLLQYSSPMYLRAEMSANMQWPTFCISCKTHMDCRDPFKINSRPEIVICVFFKSDIFSPEDHKVTRDSNPVLIFFLKASLTSIM